MSSYLQKSLNNMIWNERFYFMDEGITDMYNNYQSEKDIDKKIARLERLKAYIAKYEIPYYKEVVKELEN